MVRLVVAALAAVCLFSQWAESAEAQLFRRLRAADPQCVGAECAPRVYVLPRYAPVAPQILARVEECPPTVIQTVQETDVPVVDETSAIDEVNAQWARSAAQMRAGNSCGSGSVVAFYNGDTLVLTNAHVVGTRPGTVARVRMMVQGQEKSYEGRIIMAAYSNTYLADWAIVSVPGEIPVEPRLLSTAKPKGQHVTVGSPRCEWPLRFSTLTTADASNNSALWRWRPNAIPGQSGSGVWSPDDGLQYGIITWSWSGLGAGQQTWWIYEQAKQRTAEVGELRPFGLVELTPRDPDVIVEEGFFAQSNIGDLPIWAKPGTDPKPVPPSAEDDLDEDGRRAFKRFRDWAKERNLNWIQLLALIMEIFKLLQGLK
jgi:hypothetical protein